MSNQDDPKSAQQPPPAVVVDVGDQTTAGAGTGFGVAGVLRRWRREDMIRKGSVALRVIALLFSVLSFIIMASNKHGGWMNFDNYEEYRYVLAIAILSTLYTGLQSLKQVHQLSTGRGLIDERTSALVDFFGDQIIAYLLISSASSAVPMTDRMREGSDNLFTDSLAAAISMSFLAFLALALSAMVSGYKLSTQSQINIDMEHNAFYAFTSLRIIHCVNEYKYSASSSAAKERELELRRNQTSQNPRSYAASVKLQASMGPVRSCYWRQVKKAWPCYSCCCFSMVKVCRDCVCLHRW
ncbi:CASP-like protein [Drosera capensis]